MKHFQKSLNYLDSMILKLEQNYAVLQRTSETATSSLVSEQKLKSEVISIKHAQFESKIKQEKAKESEQIPTSKPQNNNFTGLVKPIENFFEFFKAAELRVGEIIEAKPVTNSDKLYIKRINMGDHERTILSGLQKFIPVQEMSGKVIVFCNLKPRKLAGYESNGMVLASSDKNLEFVELLRPNPNSKVGELVVLEGMETTNNQAESKPINMKNFDKFLSLLHTDEYGNAMYDHHFMKTSSGRLVVSSIKNGNIR